jgi:hypothetical protein
MKWTRLISVVVLLGACRALPSIVPLSDSAPADDVSLPSVAVSGVGGQAEADAEEEQAEVDETVVRASLPADAGSEKEPSSAVRGDAGASEAGAGELPWPGDYYGTDRFTWRGADGRETVEVDDKAHTRVERSGPNAVVITIVNSMTGEVICPLAATLSGKEARVVSGETCFGDADRAAIVTNGIATLEGDRLVLDFEGHLEPDDDEDEESVAEEGTYHFDGRRR